MVSRHTSSAMIPHKFLVRHRNMARKNQFFVDIFVEDHTELSTDLVDSIPWLASLVMLGASFLAASPIRSYYEPDGENIEKEDSNEVWPSIRKIFRPFVANIYLFSSTLYALWAILGILFYRYYNNFTWGTAYYYAMEAGLSVGFCNPSEINDWSRLFTIFYVLMGSTIVSSGIGALATFLISTRKSLVQVEHHIGAFSIYDEADKITVGSVCRFIWYHIKYCIGWYTHRSLTILIMCFLLWVGWGTAFTMVSENYSFITGVYWSVTSMATGGLQSAECLNGTSGPTCDLGSLRGALMGFFMMIGVPIYCVTLGQVARMVISASLKAHEKMLLNKPISDADFIFAANILSEQGSTTLVLGEYILLELMRLGATNQHQIEAMKRKFYELDREKRGELHMDDLRRKGLVIPRKLHSVEVAHRIRTRSMELFNNFRHSAANLSDSFIAATGSPIPTRRSSNPNNIHDPLHQDHQRYHFPEVNEGDIELSIIASTSLKNLPPQFQLQQNQQKAQDYRTQMQPPVANISKGNDNLNISSKVETLSMKRLRFDPPENGQSTFDAESVSSRDAYKGSNIGGSYRNLSNSQSNSANNSAQSTPRDAAFIDSPREQTASHSQSSLGKKSFRKSVSNLPPLPNPSTGSESRVNDSNLNYNYSSSSGSQSLPSSVHPSPRYQAIYQQLHGNADRHDNQCDIADDEEDPFASDFDYNKDELGQSFSSKITPINGGTSPIDDVISDDSSYLQENKYKTIVAKSSPK